jgi:hypothetical protein
MSPTSVAGGADLSSVPKREKLKSAYAKIEACHIKIPAKVSTYVLVAWQLNEGQIL